MQIQPFWNVGLVADTAGAARGFAIKAIDLTSTLQLICAGTVRLVDAVNKVTRGFRLLRPGLMGLLKN